MSEPRGRCQRCGRSDLVVRPLGGHRVCGSCYRHVFRRPAGCAVCGRTRPLPGDHDTGPVCAACAGIGGFRCAICHSADGAFQHTTLCRRCHVRARVGAALDVPAADIPMAIAEFFVSATPVTLQRWTRPDSRRLADLRAVVAGADHARLLVRVRRNGTGDQGMLVATHGPIDAPGVRQLAQFDEWVTGRLAAIDDTQDRRVISQFIAWDQRRRINRNIEIGNYKTWSVRNTRQAITAAVRFLAWLRHTRHTTLTALSQADLDTWYATGNTTRQNATSFVVWAQRQQLCDRRLTGPRRRVATPAGMPLEDRVELIARLLTDTTIRLDLRVAGLLVALYAQPVSRISKLRLADVTRTGSITRLTIGANDIEIIEPFGELLAGYAQQISGHWLFPGTVPGQARHTNSIGTPLLRLGVTRAARVGAFHDLAEQIPGVVLAELIGYNPNFVNERAAILATPWQHYAALRATTPT